jgi:hypothetical protein
MLGATALNPQSGGIDARDDGREKDRMREAPSDIESE